MTDDQFGEFFHRVEVRMERFDTRLDAMEKSLVDLRSEVRQGFTDLRGEMRSRFDSVDGRLGTLETRLDAKAGNWVVGLWGSTIIAWVSLMVGTAVALLKLWP